ncbi:MAG: response regulator [Spirochaetaceae bacterium]|nr:response regulator [Spirochaetaceae bacterium]
MYKLIFVDDEAIVRDGISSCILWGQNNFELAGLFENGLQALEYMKENSVDIVISDINMPRMDGLTLSRRIEEQYPEVMVLLLTGYDEFEYAQEAIKSKVREFLLKPITADELSTVLMRLEGELNFLKERKNQLELMKDKLEASFPLLKERFFYRMVSGKLDVQTLTRRKEYFGWNDYGMFYQISIISIPGNWNELDRITVSEYIKSGLKDGDELVSNRTEDLVILLQGKERGPLNLRSRTLAENVYKYVSKLEKDQISTGCGDIVNNLILLPESFRGAYNAVDYSSVLGLSQILSIEDVRSREKISTERFSELIAELNDQLKSGSRSLTLKALENIFLYLEKHFLSVLEASFYFTRIHITFINFIQEMELYIESDDTSLYQPGNLESMDNAKVFFSDLLNLIEDRIEKHRNNAVRSRIEKAKQIIAEKKGDSRFSLQEICNDVFLSVSQFSLLFKEGTGKTFIEYLTMCRIKEAKSLLKTSDLKSYEIAEKTGFTDPRYFSILFKKITAMTPMEFRRSLGE